MRKPTWLAWSSGKDSAWTLHTLRQSPDYEVVALLTTINSAQNRVAMHAVREDLLDRQAAAACLPLIKVPIPAACTNEIYEQAMSAAMHRAKSEGVHHVAFGDLFLADIRAYRESRLAPIGITPIFPLWLLDTRSLAREMISGGVSAYLTCVDPRRLDRSFAGRRFDSQFLADLPFSVDPCGENGEFHTFACAGPMFSHPIAVTPGEIVERDSFIFTDLLACDSAAST